MTVASNLPTLYVSSWKESWKQVVLAVGAAGAPDTCGLQKVWTCSWLALDRLLNKEVYDRFYAPEAAPGQADAPGAGQYPKTTYWWKVPTYGYSLVSSVPGPNSQGCVACQPVASLPTDKWVPAVERGIPPPRPSPLLV